MAMPAPSPQSEPPCTLNFQYRDFAGIPGASILGVAHAYLHVTTSTADYVVEGFRDSRKILQAQETDNGLSRDNKSADPSAGRVSGAFVCDWLSRVDSAVKRINDDRFRMS